MHAMALGANGSERQKQRPRIGKENAGGAGCAYLTLVVQIVCMILACMWENHAANCRPGSKTSRVALTAAKLGLTLDPTIKPRQVPEVLHATTCLRF